MRKVLTSLAVTLVAVVAVPALAETITNSAAQVSIEVPKGWHAKKDGESVTLVDKNEDSAVTFSVVDAGDLKESSKRLDKYLAKKIKNLTWKKEEKIDLNGMKGVALDGDGELDGKNIDLAVLVLDTPSKEKDLFVVAIAEDAKLAAHKDEIKFIFKHLQPAK